jgi:membrane-bound metal-dependent hydrolase YbcI (DUF457 family)
MPDWVSHLGAAYIGARLAGVRKIQIVLIGAILPDVAMPVFVAADLWHLPLSRDNFAYLLGFHSLLIVSLLAAALAVVRAHPIRSFLLLLAGALTHFALDVLETDIDCGMRILQPFLYWSWSPGWLTPGGLPSILLLIVSAIAIVVTLSQRAQLRLEVIRPKLMNLCFAAGLSVLAVLLPLSTRRMLVNENVHSLAFLADPARWEGQTVDLCFSEVIGISPLSIKELGREFKLANTEGLRVGDQVSVRGTYRDRTIYPTRLYNHHGFSDAWISLIGLVALLAILIPAKTNRGFVQQKRLFIHDRIKDATLRLAWRKKTN